MRNTRLLAALALGAAAIVSQAVPAGAQSQDYFIPNQPTAPKPAAPRPAPRPAQRPAPPQQAILPQNVAPLAPLGGIAGSEPSEEAMQQLNVQLPPPPELPPMPKGESPPTAVIGVLGVPDVMRGSSAAQQVEKIIGERRDKLNQDAQKEQSAWRDMQQSMERDRAAGKLSSEQYGARQRDLQERIANAQKQFRERNRIIQEAAQYSLAQIERTLISVIKQVSESRGMNLVLHRQQVALNVNQFDITEAVADQLNKVLPSVVIPPDGVSPVAQAQAKPGAATASAGKDAPAKPGSGADQPAAAKP